MKRYRNTKKYFPPAVVFIAGVIIYYYITAVAPNIIYENSVQPILSILVPIIYPDQAVFNSMPDVQNALIGWPDSKTGYRSRDTEITKSIIEVVPETSVYCPDVKTVKAYKIFFVENTYRISKVLIPLVVIIDSTDHKPICAIRATTTGLYQVYIPHTHLPTYFESVDSFDWSKEKVSKLESLLS